MKVLVRVRDAQTYVQGVLGISTAAMAMCLPESKRIPPY